MPARGDGGEVDRPAVLQVLPRLEPDVVAARAAVDMARYLRRQGWRALVASAGGRLERELAAAGGVHVRLPLDATGWLRIWQASGQLAHLLKRLRIDVVHAHAPGPAWSAALAARRRRGTSFVTTCHRLHPLRRGRADRYHRIMTAGDRTIAVSEFVAEQLGEAYGAEPARVRVVRRWLDPDEFDPERVRGHRLAALAERWGVAAGPKVVLVAGPVSPDSGHDTVLEAAAGLARRDDHGGGVLLLFAGLDDPSDGAARALADRVRRSAPGERVRFGGAIDDLPATLALADVVVVPTLAPDPDGFVAVAAQAMGKPVIVANSGALGEAVMPAATGWLLPAGEADELARTLDLALSLDEEVRGRLAARARAFVIGEFGLEPMCARLLAVYRELARPAAHPQPQLGALAEAG